MNQILLFALFVFQSIIFILFLDMQKQSTNTICVLGSANGDYFVYVPHIPSPGETIQADKYLTANGGKGANQAAAVGKLLQLQSKMKCTFTGQVGNDDQMKRLQAQMTQANVTLNWKVSNNVTTGKAFIYVDENSGENSIVIIGGANTYYQNLTVLPQQYKKSLSNCKYLLMQKQIPIQIDTLAAKYVQTLSNNTISVLDCGGRDQEIPQQMLASIRYISPNETQLLRLDPTINVQNSQQLVKQVRSKLISKYPNLRVLLKCGSRGSALITDKLYVQCPAVTKINQKILTDYKIIDTVGAGDTFTAAYCVKHSELDWSDPLKQHENYRSAMLFANSAAFLCITKKGAMPSSPWRKDVDEFMVKYDIK